MSTGAWIFTSVVTAAVIAPTAVYAAATSTVAIGNTGNSATATVTTQHQLLTAVVAPRDVVHGSGYAGPGQTVAVYTPPAGKAVVVTSVTYDLYSGMAGTDTYGYLTPATNFDVYDIAETAQAYDSRQATFPAGLPMPSIGIVNPTTSGSVYISFTGYLIPVSQLPAGASDATAMPARPLPHHP
jgi:hypothetical protein